MKDYYEFETTPSEEPCQQLGPKYDQDLARKEARRTIDQIVRQFGEPPEGSRFSITSSPHEFGSYYSIRFKYDDNNEEHYKYLSNVDENWPKEYDNQECSTT
jgi:hypothetical protein